MTAIYQIMWRRKLSTAPNDYGNKYEGLKLQTLIDAYVTLLLKDPTHIKYYSSFYILELYGKSHYTVYDSAQQASLTNWVGYNTVNTVKAVPPTLAVRNVCGIKVYVEHTEDETPF